MNRMKNKLMLVGTAFLLMSVFLASATVWQNQYCGVVSYTYGSVNCGTGHTDSEIKCGGLCYWINQIRGCVVEPNFTCNDLTCTGNTQVPVSYCHKNAAKTACICY